MNAPESDQSDQPGHPTVAALVLVIGVVLFIVAMSVASVYL